MTASGEEGPTTPQVWVEPSMSFCAFSEHSRARSVTLRCQVFFLFWLLCLMAQLCWSVWVCVLQVCHIQTKDSLTNFSEMCLLKSDIPLQSTDSQQKPCSLRLREWEWGEQELSVIKNRSQGWEMKTVLPEASLEWESLFCLGLSFTSQLPIGNGYCRYRKATPRS